MKVVRVRGTFRILDFVGDEVSLYGGTPGREKYRAFTIDRIGRRPRRAAMRGEAERR